MLRRLARAGFNKDFVASAILPDWWDAAYGADAALLPDIEIRVARFLGVPVSDLRDAAFQLRSPHYAGAQLRRVRDVDGDRLAPAIHSAIQIASAVVRNLRPSVPPPAVPPDDGLAWRSMFAPSGGTVGLPHLTNDLWQRGIPVVPIEVLPGPSFQAIACIVAERPVVLLAHKHDEPGRVAFIIGHEVGHLAAGDCQPGSPVVDDQEDVSDDADIEVKADRFATRVLVGADRVPHVEAGDARALARQAAHIEHRERVDAGAIIFAWAQRSHDYATATTAVKALYRANGARRLLREAFDKWVNVEAASESDSALLRCVYAHRTPDAVPG